MDKIQALQALQAHVDDLILQCRDIYGDKVVDAGLNNSQDEMATDFGVTLRKTIEEMLVIQKQTPMEQLTLESIQLMEHTIAIVYSTQKLAILVAITTALELLKIAKTES